jgi:para-aminobenzoate synthetase component I
MPQVQIISLPYHEDSSVWFLAIRHLPNPVWLDSGRPQSELGRYDILVADPVLTLTTEGSQTRIQTNTSDEFSSKDPFRLLSQHLKLDSSLKSDSSLENDWPFIGGAVGYWAYDLAWRLENLPRKNTQDIQLPEMQLGIYSWAIIQDHQQKTCVLIMNQAIDTAYNFSVIEDICRQNTKFHDLKHYIKSDINPFKINKLESNIKANKYAKLFASVQDYIKAGDCYQINLAQRFSSSYQGDSLLAYLHLRQQLPSPFSAFMQWNAGSVLSFSPERFLQVRGDRIETKPIKGTIARGKTPEEDLRNAQWLESSQKNRAENVMIVDLLRNDLSKHATQVEVPHLCELQSFANVHHLVSTVTGKLKPESNPIDLLRDAFPGGSITGAPKIRAMEIIEELEPHQRSIYCGSIGYISVHGQMDTNIAIRTLACDKDNIHCWGGGGIVADSICDKEYEETLAKVNLILQNLHEHFSGK